MKLRCHKISCHKVFSLGAGEGRGGDLYFERQFALEKCMGFYLEGFLRPKFYSHT